MLSKTELLYTLALQRTPNLGDTSAKKLLHHVGSAEGIFKEKPSNLLKIHGIGSFKVRQLQQKNLLDLAREELHFITSQNLSYRYFKDPKYPEKLKHCLDGPICFFKTGILTLKQKNHQHCWN